MVEMAELEVKEYQYWLNHRCTSDKEYLECVKDILESDGFRQMDNYIQHGDTTTLKHCVAVSYVTYRICRKYHLDYRTGARAGLLHDMFLYDWHTHRRETGERFHGFRHPAVALKNAKKYFTLTEKEADIIIKHMWPLTIVPPKTVEGFVVAYADKYCTLMETVSFLRRFVEFISAGNCM